MRFALGRHPVARDTGEALDRPDEHAPFDLAAIELLTADGRRTGWIATDGERTSDWLNHRDVIPIHGLVDAGAGDVPLPAAGAPIAEVRRDEIIWVVPPPLPPNRHLRLHRRRILVHLRLEAFDLTGQVHVRPGAEAADQVLRGTRVMVPLTDVEVSALDDPADRWRLPVIIVNSSHVERIVSEPQGEAPEAVAPVLGPAAAEAPSAEAPPAAAAAADAVGSALLTLLDAGVIDITEFQGLRARQGSTTR